MAVAEEPRARPAARDVVAMTFLAAGGATLAAGGFTISLTVGLLVTGAVLVLVALLLGLSE